jgi:hypothetical protein
MSAAGTQVDLALRLLDDQLFDVEEHRCGRVDDIQLRGGAGVRTEVSALLSGSGAWRKRLRKPFGSAIGALAPSYVHCIAWSEVTSVGTAVRLAHAAHEVGLEADDGRNVQWLGAPPRGTLLLSELLGARLVSSDGERLGRIWDVRAERETELADERVNETWRVTGLITGRGGWKERIGLAVEADPGEGEHFTPWEAILEIAGGTVTLGRY